jgi:hypothetical protein
VGGRLQAQAQLDHDWFLGFSIGRTMTAVTSVPAFQDGYGTACGSAESSGNGVALAGHAVRRQGSIATRLELAFHSVPSVHQPCGGDLPAIDGRPLPPGELYGYWQGLLGLSGTVQVYPMPGGFLFGEIVGGFALTTIDLGDWSAPRPVGGLGVGMTVPVGPHRLVFEGRYERIVGNARAAWMVPITLGMQFRVPRSS